MLGACLASLVRDEVIAGPAGAEAFRFAHLLIRDVTYEGMLKERRAELHERFADWLEARAGDRLGELEEIARLPPRAGVPLPRVAGTGRAHRSSRSRAAPAGTSRRPVSVPWRASTVPPP